MNSISGLNFSEILEVHGWVLRGNRGNHQIYVIEDNPSIITVPVHANRDLKRDLLHRLLKDAGLTEQDL
jgi:predicted RNA binding protein YcfA (HicA-like mRNA interferase family)